MLLAAVRPYAPEADAYVSVRRHALRPRRVSTVHIMLRTSALDP
jgi:hypothetical protein